jgi:acyl-CoA thioester hydrolase
MFGHVNNSVYLQFFDLAKLNYFHTVLGRDFDAQSIAMVVVNINCDFYAPSFIDEALEVETTTVAIGDRSLTLEQRIVNRESRQVKCIGRTIMSGFDTATAKSIAIPDESRKAVEAFECRAFPKNC